MALDYITANTGIFYRGGKVIKTINAHQTMPATTLPAELKQIVDPFEAADMTDQVLNVYSFFVGAQNDQIAIRQNLAAIWNAILTDRTSVRDQIKTTSYSIDSAFWDLLWKTMLAESANIKASVVTIGTVTANAGNHGNGTVLMSAVLDGFNPPLLAGPAVLHYLGLLSELCVPTETMTFEIVGDFQTGSTLGRESVAWRGGVAGPELDWQTEGSGDGPQLTVCGDGGLVVDGAFENWTNTNTPTNWTLITGAVAGTTIFQSTVTANIYRGSAALKILGDGATVTIAINQDLTGKLDAGRMYNLNFRLKASSAPAAGDLAVTLGWTMQNSGSGSATISVAHGSLPTSWTLKNLFFNTPLETMLTITLTISVTGTLTNTVAVYIDQLALVPATYHGGVCAVAVPGAIDFVRGDKFTATIANSEGVFQKFFRRHFGVQLPSVTDASETIVDGLAT